jgi:hypothetical protein
MEIACCNMKNATVLITIPAQTVILREQSQTYKEVELDFDYYETTELSFQFYLIIVSSLTFCYNSTFLWFKIM